MRQAWTHQVQRKQRLGLSVGRWRRQVGGHFRHVPDAAPPERPQAQRQPHPREEQQHQPRQPHHAQQQQRQRRYGHGNEVYVWQPTERQRPGQAPQAPGSGRVQRAGPDTLMQAVMAARSVHELSEIVLSAQAQPRAEPAPQLQSRERERVQEQQQQPQVCMKPVVTATPAATTGASTPAPVAVGQLPRATVGPLLQPIHIAAAITRLPKLPSQHASTATGTRNKRPSQTPPHDAFQESTGANAAAGGGAGSTVTTTTTATTASSGSSSSSSVGPWVSSLPEAQQLLLHLLATAASQISRFQPRQLANMLWAVARLAAAPGEAPSCVSSANNGGGSGGGSGGGWIHGGGARASDPQWAARLAPYLDALMSEAVGQPIRARARGAPDSGPGQLPRQGQGEFEPVSQPEQVAVSPGGRPGAEGGGGVGSAGGEVRTEAEGRSEEAAARTAAGTALQGGKGAEIKDAAAAGSGAATGAAARPIPAVDLTRVHTRGPSGEPAAAVRPSHTRPAASKLDACSGRELANFAWAAATLGVTDAAVWDAIIRAATAKLPAAVGGRAGLQGRPQASDRGVESPGGASGGRGSGGSGSRRGGLGDGGGGSGAAAAGQDRDERSGALTELNAADVANLAWALARAQQQPGAALGRGLVAAALQRLEEFDPPSLAGLLWGLGTLAGSLPAPSRPQPAAPASSGPSAPPSSSPDSQRQRPQQQRQHRPIGPCSRSTHAPPGVAAAAEGAWARSPAGLPALLERAGPLVAVQAAKGRLRPRELMSIGLGLAAGSGCCAPPRVLVQALAVDTQSHAAAYASPAAGHSPDHLARMLQALVRCATHGNVAAAGGRSWVPDAAGGIDSDGGSDEEASGRRRRDGGGGGGARTDPRVARHVERALERAARHVVRGLPRTSPEGLTALAVAYATPVGPAAAAAAAGVGRISAARQTTSSSGTTGGIQTAAAAAAADAAGGSDAVAMYAPAAPGVLPPLPEAADLTAEAAAAATATATSSDPRVSPLRRAVLRATLRAALRLLKALPAPCPVSDPVPAAAAKPAPAPRATRGSVPATAAADPARLGELVGAVGWCVRGLVAGGDEGRAEAAEDLTYAAPEVERVLTLCGPAELAQLSAAYARAACQPPALVAALSAAARAAAPRLSPLDVSMLAWAAAAGGGPASRDALLLSVLEQRATELLAAQRWGPPGQELANTLWAFAKLNLYSEPLLEAAAAALRSYGTERMRPLEVAMTAAALGQLRFFDAGLMAALAARMAADAPGYSSRVLCWALSAFATLNSYHPALLRAAAARTRQLLPPRPPRPASDAAATAVTAAPRGGTDAAPTPPAAAAPRSALAPGAARPAAEAPAEGGLSAFDVVTLLWCLGVLQYGDAECVEALVGALPRDPRVFTTPELARLGLAEAMLGGALARQPRRRRRTQRSRPDAPGGGVVVAAAAETAAPSAPRSAARRLLPAELRRAVAAAIRSQRPGRAAVSALQQDVCDTLGAMGLQPRVEVPHGIFSLDLCLDLHPSWNWAGAAPPPPPRQQQQQQPEQPQQQQPQQGAGRSRGPRRRGGGAGPGAEGAGSGGGAATQDAGAAAGQCAELRGAKPVRVAVEVDGPSHFTANVPNHPLGGTLARDRCLQDSGLALLVVPWFEWRALQTLESKQSYLARRLAAALGAARGRQPPASRSASRSTASAASQLFPNMVVTQHVVKGGGSAPSAGRAVTV